MKRLLLLALPLALAGCPKPADQAAAPAAPASAPAPETPAFIFFTSGSTGKPKGVTHSHATFGWIVASAIVGLGIALSDVFLPATSASHIAASSFCLAGLAAGARVAIGGELLTIKDAKPLPASD